MLVIFLLNIMVCLFLVACNNEDYTYVPDAIEALEVTSISANEGDVGTEIIIKGTNFSELPSNNKVRFNEVLAVVKTAAKDSLQVVVPNAINQGEVSAMVKVTVSHAKYTVDAGNFTINKPIVTAKFSLLNGDDDVEEVAVDFGEPVGTMILDSSDLELGEISSGEGLMNIGLRYQNITLPKGAIISEAYIQFNTDNVGANPVEITIYGEDTGDASAYNTSLGNLSGRALTQAKEVWSIDAWENVGDRSEAQRTVNIASVIQEIINREDWDSGNSLNLILKHSGASLNVTSSSGGREAEDFSSNNPLDGAELNVVYQ